MSEALFCLTHKDEHARDTQARKGLRFSNFTSEKKTRNEIKTISVLTKCISHDQMSDKKMRKMFLSLTFHNNLSLEFKLTIENLSTKQDAENTDVVNSHCNY